MRIVSWVVVLASLGALSWLGISPLLPRLELSGVDAEIAVGTTIANTARASIEVAQAELEARDCEASREKARGHVPPGQAVPDAKRPEPTCEK